MQSSYAPAASDPAVAHPATSLGPQSAGFTPEERASFSACYTDNGFVDTFREQHPGIVAYSYWSQRAKMRESNRGWRLDYVLVSQNLKDRCHDAFILRSVKGSDHVPVGLTLRAD